jgi:hypothetical protein
MKILSKSWDIALSLAFRKLSQSIVSRLWGHVVFNALAWVFMKKYW